MRDSVVFLWRQFVSALILIFFVIVLNFVLIHLAPGSVVDTITGEMGGATEQVAQELRESYGLDKSMPEQLWVYTTNVISGDLGRSYYHGQPVVDLIFERLPATALLVLTSLVLAVVTGSLLGVVGACRPHGALAYTVTVLSLLAFAMPVFWLGLMLLLLFASVMPIFPAFGMAEPMQLGGLLSQTLDVAHHLILPAFTLAAVYLAQYARIIYASMSEVLGADYIRTAQAKGLHPLRVILKHALRNAVMPVVTLTGIQFSRMIAGAIVVETVFNWPGMGQLVFQSLLRRDQPVLLGVLIFSAVFVIIANAITDWVYRLIDPRVRGSGVE